MVLLLQAHAHLSVPPCTATSASRLPKLGRAAQQRMTSNCFAITWQCKQQQQMAMQAAARQHEQVHACLIMMNA